jgi:DNA-binding LacI/PurR family transcriptional regulator
MTTELAPNVSAETRGRPRRTKHAALTERLREMVVARRPGDRLPPQSELMRQFGVSDRTVLRSLDDLQRDGWIVRRPGSGTYVADPRQPTAVQHTITAVARHFFAASYLRVCADILAAEAETAGRTLVCHVARSTDDHDALLRALAADAPQPAWYVLLGYPLAPVAAGLIARGHRAVVIGSPPAGVDPDVPCVRADHEIGGYVAARHLLTLGHRRIAFAYDGQLKYSYDEHPRWLGHCRALDEARRASRDELSSVVIDGETLAAWREDPARAAAFLRRPDAPTGIATWNDSIAIMLLGVLHRTGLRVPGDVSVVGFDDLPEAQDSVPPLTSLDQHVAWQVRTAVRLLARPVPPPPQAVIALPDLKVRLSTGPPPTPR